MLTCRHLTELLNGADNYSHLFFRKKGHNNQVSKLTSHYVFPILFSDSVRQRPLSESLVRFHARSAVKKQPDTNPLSPRGQC